MTIQINIDDEKLKNLVENKVDNLDDETVRDLACQALRKYMDNPENAKNLILENTSDYSWEWKLKPWLQAKLTGLVNDDDVKEFKDFIMGYMKEHAQELVLQAMVYAYTNTMFTYDARTQFAQEICRSIRGER